MAFPLWCCNHKRDIQTLFYYLIGRRRFLQREQYNRFCQFNYWASLLRLRIIWDQLIACGVFLNSKIELTETDSLYLKLTVLKYVLTISSCLYEIYIEYRYDQRNYNHLLFICYFQIFPFYSFFCLSDLHFKQIVEEAGGVVSRMDGENFCVFDRSVLVSNGVLHAQVSLNLHRFGVTVQVLGLPLVNGIA